MTTWFVIVCAERTGSNLLASMLCSHPDVDVAGELFNDRHLDEPVSWGPVENRVDLVALRRSDSLAFLDQLGAVARQRGLQAFGFKLMYNHALREPRVLEYVAGLADLKVIHLRRRNRLARFLSWRRALQSDQWAAPAGSGEAAPPAALRLEPQECLLDFALVADLEQRTDRFFASKSVLQLCYEDLAADPLVVGAQVTAFLGLHACELRIGHRKTGGCRLREAISNHDELKATVREWLSWFDDDRPGS